MQKEKFDIQGMTCSSCQAHVEKAVEKIEGVKQVNVNLLSNSMIAEYDEKMVNNDKIIKAIVEAGYGANVHEENKNVKKEEKVDKTKENTKAMKKRLCISIAFLIPLMYIAMHHMIHSVLHIPVPKIIDALFHGAENGVTFGLTQFLLLLPIIYVNRNFFIVRI